MSATRIYIDTNVFLDFYQSTTDRLIVFQDMVERAEQIVITRQTINEFRRNRTARLVELASNIEKTAGINLYTTSIVQEMGQFKALVSARDEAKKHMRAIADQLREWARAGSSDPVYTEFIKLAFSATLLETTDAAIERAKRRKVLGEPPTSPDRHSVGDEVIWETLLTGCEGDLIVVSRDRTFLDNAELLRNEYEAKRGRKLVLVTQHLKEALERVGAPSPRIAEAEKALQRRSIITHIDDTCPQCDVGMVRRGFEGPDGDEVWWFECLNCGHQTFPE